MILLLLSALAVSFFFTGLESGILAANPVRIRHQARMSAPGKRAPRLATLLEQPGRLLLTCALLTNFANTIALLVLFSLLVRHLGPLWTVPVLIAAAPVWAVFLGVIPKVIFRRFPIRTLGSFVDLLDLVNRLLSPFLILFERIFAPLLAARAERSRGSWESREEIKFLTDQSHRAGALSKAERQMIHAVIDFRETRARDVMVPWERVTALPSGAPLAEAVETARRTGLDRIPVLDFAADPPRPAGLLVVADLLFDPVPAGKTLADYLRRPVVCGETDSAFKVVRQMRAARAPMAIVTNAAGAPAGIITSEEIAARMLQPPA